jgi:hypothetical protein
MKRKLILIVTVVLTTLTTWSLRAGVNPHMVEVDLDIDYLAADDPTEWTPGGFVCVEGRRKITLQKVQPVDWGTTSGDSTKRVRLSWGSTKIAIYDAATGGNAVISGTDYANANLPTNFWVEGVAVSATAGTSTAQGPETILAQAIPDGMYDRISFTVVDFTKLMLTDAVTDENVADTTLFDELQYQANTLYVAEASNGTAELTIQGWWQPDDIDGDQFRWKVLLTNEANEATATTTHWAPDNNGTFTMNPQTLTWTSNTVSGLPDRTFKILGWYDCNGNGVYDSDEPHRLLYVSVYNFQIVWAQRNSPWKVADYTAAQSVQQPLGCQVGQPGGEGGFGGPPTGSEFGRLSDPFTVKNYELIDNGSGSSRTLKLTMLSNVSAWSNDYVLTEQGVNSDIFADEEDGLAVRRVLEQNVADSAKGPDRETVLMASVAFGAERIMTVYKPQNGSVYEAERVTVEIEMSALPATNVADTITVTVVSSLRPGLVETGVLVETSVDSLVFARSDGELKMQIVRITDKDATGADDLTAVLSSKALEISGSTVDAMETGAKSLVFRTDAISASGGAIENGAKSLVFRIDAISASGGAAGTGGGASSYVAIGAIWVPLGAIAKDKVGQPTFPGYWQGTTLPAKVTRRRGMILEDYPNDLEWSKAAEQLPPAGASTDCKYYTFAPLKIFHVIDDDGATPVFSDVLPFLPIIPGLPSTMPSVTIVKAKGGDILKAKPVGYAEPYDEVTILEVDMTAYRPQSPDAANYPLREDFPRTAVPDDKEESPGAGIRANGMDVDENLIEVVLVREPASASGVSYFIKRQNSKLKVWEDSSRTTVLLDSTDEADITSKTFPLTLWVEYPYSMGDPAPVECELYFEARDSGGTVVDDDKVLFYPFKSAVIGLSGEDWPAYGTGPFPAADNGFYQLSKKLYEEGYDVHYFDEDAVSCAPNAGMGEALTQLMVSFIHRHVRECAIFGTSHGGGSTHDLADVVNTSISGMSIPFTAYSDGLRNFEPSLMMTSQASDAPETRKPPGSGYHVNFYQTLGSDPGLVGWMLSVFGYDFVGARVTGADYEVHVTGTSWGASVRHGDMDDEADHIHATIIEKLKGKVDR